MSMPERAAVGHVAPLVVAALLASACAPDPTPAAAPATAALRGGPALGRPVTANIVRQLDISIAADGTGLPPGSGSVSEGRAIFAAKCAACHGATGEGGVADRLTGGTGTLHSAKPVKTVASYWPYAPPLFDYIRRAMPLTAPQSLEDGEVYGLVAYMLSIDGIVPPAARLDAATLAQLRMPNRNGFVSLEDRSFDGNVERMEGENKRQLSGSQSAGMHD